jgi:hypothetical protein
MNNKYFASYFFIGNAFSRKCDQMLYFKLTSIFLPAPGENWFA